MLEGTKSTKDDVLSGVPQGTVLGPLLFLAYVNDMPECTSSDIRLFADDSLVYRVIRNDSDRQTLQKDIDALEQWEKTWLMSFNDSKCYVVHMPRFMKKTHRRQFRLHNKCWNLFHTASTFELLWHRTSSGTPTYKMWQPKGIES